MKAFFILSMVIFLTNIANQSFAQSPEEKKKIQEAQLDSVKTILIGEWKMTRASINDKEKKKVNGFMIFLDNGMFYNEEATDPLTPNGKYKMMPNNTIQITIGIEKYKNKIKELNDTALTLEMKTPEKDVIIMQFKRSLEKIEIKGY